MCKIKVMVVDDSAFMRKIISDMINEEDDLDVISTARNGEEFLEKVEDIKPDVITLDIEMPRMDGITVLKHLKIKKIKIPVIVLSSVSNEYASKTIECLYKGAFDFLAKPSDAILNMNHIKNELIKKIRVAYSLTSREIDIKHNLKLNQNKNFNNLNKKKAVVIGASTGGTRALYSIVTKLPKDLGVPIFIVQHMPIGFTKAFAERLNNNSELTVVEVTDGQAIEKNTVYIAKGGYHMEIGRDKRIHLNLEPTIWGVRPSVDKLFFSASKIYGDSLLSVLLTGMGRDGANGTARIKDCGGTTIAEDKSSCIIYGMPKAAYETGKVDLILPLNDIADEIIKNVK